MRRAAFAWPFPFEPSRTLPGFFTCTGDWASKTAEDAELTGVNLCARQSPPKPIN